MLRASLLFLACATVAGCGGEPERPSLPVVATFGGQYLEDLRGLWIQPAARQAFGAEVRVENHAAEYKRIEDMARTGTATWDLVQVETWFAARMAQEGLLERVQPAVPEQRLDPTIPVGNLKGLAYPLLAYSYVVAWNKAALVRALAQAGAPADRTPAGWGDFWDVRTFPGSRAMRDVPQGNIEAALLASGLSAEQITERLYDREELGLIDVAFKKLDELRGLTDIIWWKSGDMCQRELEAERAVMCAAWSGRVWGARNSPLSVSAPPPDVRSTFGGAILDYSWWIIPRHATNSAGAAKLLGALYEGTDQAIVFARKQGYGPTISGWEDRVSMSADAELRAYLPTTSAARVVQLATKPEFWAKHHTALSARWREWQSR